MTMNQNVRTGTAPQIVERFALSTIRSMARWFEQKTGHVFSVNARVDFSPKRRASHGGIRRDEAIVSIAAHKVTEALRNDKKHTHREYAHYKHDPVIGEFTASWDKCLAADIAHEMAHAVQWYFQESSPRIRQFLGITAPFELNHGEYFQQLYRAFREQFVNYAEFGQPCVLIAEQVVAPKPIEKKRAVKGIKMKLSKSKNGWFIHEYFDEAGKLLGKMASKPRFVSKGWINGEWKDITKPNGDFFKNHNEAKKHFLKL